MLKLGLMTDLSEISSLAEYLVNFLASKSDRSQTLKLSSTNYLSRKDI